MHNLNEEQIKQAQEMLSKIKYREEFDTTVKIFSMFMAAFEALVEKVYLNYEELRSEIEELKND